MVQGLVNPAVVDATRQHLRSDEYRDARQGALNLIPMNRREEEKKAALEAIRRARLLALKADRDGAKASAARLYEMPGVQAAIQGGMQGLSHGLADDFERAGTETLYGSDAQDHYLDRTGERIATNQVLAKAADPLAYGAGMTLGALAAGLATRGGTKALGGALKGRAVAKRMAGLDRIDKDYASIGKKPQLRKAVDAEFEKGSRFADRVGNAGFKSNRNQTVFLDTGHAALMGYGGLDPNADEEMVSLERLARAGLGGAAGFALAPAMATTGSVGAQAMKYGQQQAGGMPATPLRKAKLRPGLEPDAALLQVLGMDEFAARQARPDGAGRMQGASPNPLLDAEAANVRGLVDHAITAPAGRQMMADNTLQSVPQLPTQTQVARIERMSEAPGGGGAAMDMARELQARAAGDSRRALEKEVTAGAGAGSPGTPAQARTLDGLMQAFEAGDAPVAADWGRVLANNPAVQGNVRGRMYQTLLRAFDTGGYEGLEAMVSDPSRRPFFDAAGLSSRLADILGARDRNGKYQAVSRLMSQLEANVARDASKKAQPPRYANKRDQKVARYQMADEDSAAITRAAMPGRTFSMPGYVPPLDPSNTPPLLEATRAPFKAYMGEAWRGARAKFGQGVDFDPADVTIGGTAATGLAALLESEVIGPLIKQLIAAGVPPEEIQRRLAAEAAARSAPAPGQ